MRCLLHLNFLEQKKEDAHADGHGYGLYYFINWRTPLECVYIDSEPWPAPRRGAHILASQIQSNFTNSHCAWHHRMGTLVNLKWKHMRKYLQHSCKYSKPSLALAESPGIFRHLLSVCGLLAVGTGQVHGKQILRRCCLAHNRWKTDRFISKDENVWQILR